MKNKIVKAAEAAPTPPSAPGNPQRATEELLTRKLANFSVNPEIKNNKILIGAIAKTLGDTGLGSLCSPKDNIGSDDLDELESKGYDATVFNSHGVRVCQPISEYRSGQFLYCFKDASIIGIGETVVKNDEGEDEILAGRINGGWWRPDGESEYSFVLFTPNADDVFKVKPVFYYTDKLKTRLKTRGGEKNDIPVDPVRMQYIMDQKTKILHDNPKIWARLFYNSVYVRYTSNFFEDMFASVFGFNEFRKPITSVVGENGAVPVLSQGGLAGQAGIQGSSVIGTLDNADPIAAFSKQRNNELMRLRTMAKSPNETPDYSGVIKQTADQVPATWSDFAGAASPGGAWDPANRWALRAHRPTGGVPLPPAPPKPPKGAEIDGEMILTPKNKAVKKMVLGLDVAPEFPIDLSNQVEYADDVRDDSYLQTLNEEERNLLGSIADWKKLVTAPELIENITGNRYAKNAMLNSFLLDRTCAVYSFTYRPQAADMAQEGGPSIPRTRSLSDDSLTPQDLFAITLVYKFADATRTETETAFDPKGGKVNTPFSDYDFDPNSQGNPASIHIFIDRAPDKHAIAIYDMMKQFFGALGSKMRTESGAKSFHQHGDSSDWKKSLDSKIDKLDAEIDILIGELEKYHVPFSSKDLARPKIERGKDKAILFLEMQAYLFKLKTYELPKSNQDIDEELYNFKVQAGNYAGFDIGLINFVRLLKD